MLFMVHMEVDPKKVDADTFAELAKKETEISLGYQRSGKVAGIWRVAGRYANYTLFDVDSNDELHDLLRGLPLFQCIDAHVTPLALHPSSMEANGESRGGQSLPSR